MAGFKAFSTGVGGSHLKHCGSRPAILTVMMDDRVPSSAKLFLVLVLFSPTMQKTLSVPAFKWGSTSTNAAILESLPNCLKLVTFEKRNQGPILLKCFAFIISINYVYVMCCRILRNLLLVEHITPPQLLNIKSGGILGNGDIHELILQELLTYFVLFLWPKERK